MLFTLLLLITAAAVLEAQPFRGSCSRLEACLNTTTEWPSGEGGYKKCKSELKEEFGKVQGCLKKGLQDTIQAEDCQCPPVYATDFYYFLSPAYSVITTVQSCGRDSEQCQELKKECFAVKGGPDPSLLNGTCNTQQREMKQQLERCMVAMEKSDLSNCGFMQDVANEILPLIPYFKKLACSECNLFMKVRNCASTHFQSGGRLPPEANTACRSMYSISAIATCAIQAVILDEACRSLVPDLNDMLLKIKEFPLVKREFDKCELENILKYEEKYTSWGCSKGKGETNIRDERDASDLLQDTWSAITRFFQ